MELLTLVLLVFTAKKDAKMKLKKFYDFIIGFASDQVLNFNLCFYMLQIRKFQFFSPCMSFHL